MFLNLGFPEQYTEDRRTPLYIYIYIYTYICVYIYIYTRRRKKRLAGPRQQHAGTEHAMLAVMNV